MALSRFVTSTKQYDDIITFSDQIEPVAGAIVNAQFKDTTAY